MSESYITWHLCYPCYKRFGIVVVVVMLCSAWCTAQVSLLPADPLDGFTLFGASYASFSRQPVSDMPFNEALDLVVTTPGLNPEDVQLVANNAAIVSAGDAIVLSFYYRRVDSVVEWGDMQTVWENVSNPLKRSLDIQWYPRGEWRRRSFVFVCLEDSLVGAGKFSFWLGGLIQHVQIGGIELKHYGPRSILGSDPLSQFSSGTIISVADHPGHDQALLLDCAEVPANPWALQASATLNSAVNQNDSMVAVFHLKDMDGDANQAIVGPVVERGSDPWTKSLENTVLGESDGWKHVILPFKMVESYQSGEWMFHFRYGYQIQQLALCGIDLLHFGTDLDADSLTAVYGTVYPGQEPDAPWRDEAQQRIEQYRKSDLVVHVTDTSGGDIFGADVSIRMTRHAFGFGSAVDAEWLLSTSADGLQYQQVVRDTFNKVVMENDLKWPVWEVRPQSTRDGIQWLIDNGITDIRGHNLVWPGWQYMPSDVESLYGDDLRNRILNHIQDELGDYGVNGKCIDWDVVNEPYSNHDVMDRLNDYTVMRDWFNLAHQLDPPARLFFNDYSLITSGGATQVKQDYFINMIQEYQLAGIPLHGMGFQGHFGATVTGPETVYAILDRFAALGIVLQVTEYDHSVSDELLQADYLRDLLTVVFSHPSVDAFLMWGFYDGKHWKGNAPLYRSDWSMKPSGQVWYDLIFSQWWTESDQVTDGSGICSVTGFLGDYEITVSAQGESEIVSASLPAGGATVQVSLPISQDLPLPPSNLEAVPVSGSEIVLTWQDNADDELGYVVHRKTGGGAFNEIAVLSDNTTQYTDMTDIYGLVQYTYRVGAYK